MKRLGFRPAQVAQRIVNGFGGATVPVTGCHFLPLIDVRGNHQVICAIEVEEITTVAETRLPPWAKEVFPSVRAHMPWMDTPAGPIELLIGLDNSQWLPVCLEDSKEPVVNMRLMKSSFGHQFMVMGGWGTALYPRDESMRYRGDPSGSRLTHAEMAQKVRLERCFRGRSQPGPRSGGRAPIKGPSPVLERTAPDYGPVGSRRPATPRRDCTAATQEDGATTNKDALQPSTGAPSAEPGRTRQRWSRSRGSHWASATTGTAAPPPDRDARFAATARTCRPDPEAGPHDGLDGTGDAAGVQLQHRHWMRGDVGHGHIRAKDLSAGWVRRRHRDLGNEGRVGREAVEETTCDTLHGNAVISILHVRSGWPDEEGQI